MQISSDLPLSAALKSFHEANTHRRRRAAYKVALESLVAGANGNAAMSLNRWIGTPLAFAWRVVCSPQLCTLLLSHGAELFTDDPLTIRGAIGAVGPKSKSLTLTVISGLRDPNRRYSWGVPLAPFAIYEDASDDRREIIRCLLHAGADPTLTFEHSLFSLQGFSTDRIKPYNLKGLAAIQNELDDPDRRWPSGKTLEEAWEETVAASQSKGFELFKMARDATANHVGFEATTEAQRAVATQLWNRGFHTEGSWGHEAGHAVACVLLRRQIARVWLNIEDGSSGGVVCYRHPNLNPRRAMNRSHFLRNVMRELVIYFSGLAAEECFFGKRTCLARIESDINGITTLAERVTPNRSQAVAIGVDAYQRTTSLMTAHRAKVNRVAKALIKHGRLPRTEVCLLCSKPSAVVTR